MPVIQGFDLAEDDHLDSGKYPSQPKTIPPLARWLCESDSCIPRRMSPDFHMDRSENSVILLTRQPIAF